MCGICGVIRFGGREGAPVDPWALHRMTDALAHRGPDESGVRTAPGVAFGARRLSIVDVEAGHQPLSNEDGGVWAMLNGELYNHGRLRADLERRGHRFATRCDTEVLPHLYEEYGGALVDHLRGMFALAVWDTRAQRGVIARDRIGIKPLYYARRADSLVFSSELKGLLAGGLVDVDLDLEAVDAFLALGFFPGERTPLTGVRKLLPGERLVVDREGSRLERYWQYPHPVVESEATDHELEEELRDLLEESVELRLMSDVPLGAMLSGGLDSSLVVALMARHMAEPVRTFSVGFREAGAANELGAAREVASLFGTDHSEIELSFREHCVDIADLVWWLDEPVADLSSLGFYALSELASRSVKVTLSGQGADELFGGYARHRNAVVAAWWDRLPGVARHGLLAPAGRGPARLRRAAALLGADSHATRWLAANGRLDARSRARLVTGRLAALDGRAPLLEVESRLDGLAGAPLPAMLYLDGQLGLVDGMLHYFDRCSMAHSLEVRVPFLDHHVVEFAARVPPSLKVRRLRTKYLLKEVARGILPDRIVDRPKVGFLNAAVGDWFREQTSASVGDYLLDADPTCAEFLDPAAVRSLVARHAAGARGHGERVLLPLLMLEVWLRSFLPRALPRPGPSNAARTPLTATMAPASPA